MSDTPQNSSTTLDTIKATRDEETQGLGALKAADHDLNCSDSAAQASPDDQDGNDTDDSSTPTEIWVCIDGHKWLATNSPDCPILEEFSTRQSEDATLRVLTDSVSRIYRTGRKAFMAVEEANEHYLHKALETEKVVQEFFHEAWARCSRFRHDIRIRRRRWMSEHAPMATGPQ
ncbi:hypothetical protein MMC13_000158 [Lambiella insularis]|nr:hypothetical protein [Lambiella insularis]